MLRILLVKTSSLGDVVHNFPVVSDVRRHFPDARIDWVVEEAYVPLVRLHPGVRRAVPVALRRWRKQPLGRRTWRDIAEFRQLSLAEQYDAIIDTQGLLKSALMSRAAHGRRHGFDAASAREGLAARFYDITHHVRRGQHAVLRNRLLAAASLGYRLEGESDYGLPQASVAGAKYGVLLHGSSRPDKLWPIASWIALGRELERAGYECVLPWGDEAERQRSEAMAGQLTRARVPPRLPLDRVAELLQGAAAVVGVDTGLVHLATALGRPVAAIFCGSHPELTGVFGSPAAVNLGHSGHAPSPAEVLAALRTLKAL